MPGSFVAVVVMYILQVVVLRRRRKHSWCHGDDFPSGKWDRCPGVAYAAGGGLPPLCFCSCVLEQALDLLSSLMSRNS